MFFILSAILLSSSAAHATTIRVASTANAYPYNYPCEVSAENPEGLCGVEVQYIKRVCADVKLNCVWQKIDWAGPSGPMNPGGALYELTHPRPDGSFAYDAVVGSVNASPDRRPEMLFTIPYYTARHIFIGHQSLGIEIDATSGFPKDRSYFSGRKLRIGTYPGFLTDELKRVYGNAAHIEIVKGTPAELVGGQIDLLFAWTGIDKMVNDMLGGAGSYKIFSDVGDVNPDPFGGVAVATRISREGRRFTELMNNGIIQSRRGNGGYHKTLFESAVGVDLWHCRGAPYVIGDPKCFDREK